MISPNPYVVILASAGSGKTYRLTHHLVGQIYQELRHNGDGSVVERLLAATFTRKAAGEITARVLELLAESVRDPKQRLALSREIRGDDALDEDLCGAMLQAVVRRLHRMQVCTLDAFMIRAAQAFAPELGITAPWSILDDTDDQALSLEAIDAVLDEHAADPDARQRMVELLIQINRGNYPVRVRGRLFEHLREGYAALLAGPDQAWEVIDAGAWRLLEDTKLHECVCDLAKRLTPHVPTTKTGQPNKRWLTAIEAVCGAAGEKNWSKLLSSGLLAAMLDPNPSYFGAPFPEAIIEILRPLVQHCAAALLLRQRERNIAARDLLRHYDRAYRRAKSARSAWRFNDIPALLDEAGVAAPEKLDDFYFRLDGRLDHLMLDEFQDTSIAQWRMLKPLAEEVVSGGEGAQGTQRTFFLVGDVKQTLYGWRNAEPRLLDQLLGDWPQLTRENLTESYRSAPVVIDTVNAIFQNLVGNPALVGGDDQAHFDAAAHAWSAWFQPHSTHLVNQSGYCRLSTCAAGDDVATRQRHAIRLAAARVRALREAGAGGDIAILVRRRKFVAIAMNELRKLEIPCAGEGGNPLVDDAAVCAALSLLHLLDHPSDTAAQYHVGVSPLGEALQLTPQTPRPQVLALATRLRTEILDRGLGRVLNDWLGTFAAACDGRNFRRFGQLIELAYAFAYDGGEFRGFLDLARTQSFEEGAVAPVRVMTIHGAKGRQFHHVILPDLDGPFLSGGGAGILLDRPDVLEPATCISYGPDKLLRKLDERLARLDEAQKSRQVIEEICALYVAITRARTGVEMIVHPQAPSSGGNVNLPHSAAGVLRGVFAPGAADPETDLWTAPDSVFPAPTQPAAPRPAAETPRPAEMLSVSVVPPPQGQSRNRPMVSPSGLEGGHYVDLGAALSSLERVTSLDRGTVLHRWFEQVAWLDGFEPDPDALGRAVADLSLGRPQLDELLARFTAACRQPNVRRMLERAPCQARLDPASELELWRERSFVVPMRAAGSPSLVHGQLDRVVVGRCAGRAVSAEIVDYKSDRVSPGAAVKERAKHYRPQLLAYRAAVATLLGLDLSRVSANLVFIEADTVVPVSD